MDDLRGRASVVIPVFNQAFYTRVCLMSLERRQGDAEVVVVDNGSTDETPSLLRGWSSDGPGRCVVTLPENQGFARGCNAGAARAGREFAVFLNNDTFVLEGWLGGLLAPFAEADVQVTGSRLLYPSGRVQHAGVAFDHLGPHHVFAGLPGDSPVVLVQRDCQVVTGAALAIRRTEFERLGGFDASYENSFEDVDLCLRVRRDGGRVVYAPASVAYHFESVTEGRRGPTDVRNYELFMARWKAAYEHDLPGLLEEARRQGVDPERERARSELEELRIITGLRSVRAALWARGLFHRIVRWRRDESVDPS